ncbi:MAG TPA: DNA polymerase IV [Terriglobia bacterium]
MDTAPVRQILHVDMDAFYVSVEEIENPSLRGKAVIVGADPDGRGVVTAASYEARKFGVHSAQPIGSAKKLCPHAVFLRGNYTKYAQYSKRLHGIFAEFTPVVQMVSIDEAYLDLTGSERLHGPALCAADRLIREVKERTGLNCSVGTATSHVVAKIASDQAKPHGLLCVFPGRESAFLGPLPVRRMPGIGKVTEPELASLGIWTIGDIQVFGLDRLRQRFGKYGEWLHMKSIGKDIEAYRYSEETRQISHETTFDRDTSDAVELERTLSLLSQRVARRLREHAFYARTIGLKIRFAPFRTVTRDVTLAEPTQLDAVVFEHVLRLFEKTFRASQKVRLLGVRASNLERGTFQQNLLAAPAHERLDRLARAADEVRNKFGFDSVRLARSLEPGSKSGKKQKG